MNNIARYTPGSLMSPEPFSGGVFLRKLQKWALEDIEKIYDFRNKIAQHDFNITKAMIDKQIAIETASEKMDLEFKSIQCQKTTVQLIVQEREAELIGKLLLNDCQKEKNDQEKEKNKQLKLETQSQEIEIEMKLKAQREYLNGTNQT